MHKQKLENASLLVLFTGISILLFLVFRPFFAALSLAVVFAIIFYAPYESMVRLFGNRKNVASLTVVSLLFLFFIVPIFALGVQILQEAQTVYVGVQGNETQYLEVVQHAVENVARQIFPGFVFDVNAALRSALTFISSNLGVLVYNTVYVLFDTFLMLLALFFFLRDGRSLLHAFVRLSPFGKEATHEILGAMYATIQSVVSGTLFIVLIRWIFLGIAFYVFGIPHAIFWSSVGGIAGAIPGIGTSVAFIGAVGYLYLQGNILGAIGMTILGGTAVILIDNILTSYFFGKGLEVASIFVLFSILGGILLFGPIGFVMGPLVLAVFLSVIRVYDGIEREAA